MQKIRPPAVAGQFYPAEAQALQQTLQDLLQQAKHDGPAPPAKAIIVPHAGYIYSGPIAARAYAQLKPLRNIVRRIVLLGPAHRISFTGLACSSANSFQTPLGDIPLDRAAIDKLAVLPQVHMRDEAHRLEHSLEVQLPFLQEVLHEFSLIPLVVGDASAEEVAEVLELLWGGPETLIIISTDLSHYHDYSTAQLIDQKTANNIEQLNYQRLSTDSACGRNPLRGLLLIAQQRQLKIETLDLRNSGDTAGSQDAVVGYGAWILHEARAA